MSGLEIRALEESGKSGAEALRDGRRVGRLVGELRAAAPSRGAHVWVSLDDHELAAGENTALYGDLYAAAGDPWVRAGHRSHFVVVPPVPAITDAWFALGFGIEQVHAERSTAVDPRPAPAGVTIRRVGLEDLEPLLDIAHTLSEHQIGPPVWSGLAVPEREASREGWTELLEDETAIVLLAERAGKPVGYVGLYREEPGVAEIPVAATLPDERGAGLGAALVAQVLALAREAGHELCRLDWRSTNLLASRFWTNQGFVPTHLRLRRDVQPYA